MTWSHWIERNEMCKYWSFCQDGPEVIWIHKHPCNRSLIIQLNWQIQR